MQRANRSSLMSRLKTWFAYRAGRGAAAFWKREHYIYDNEAFVTTKYSWKATFFRVRRRKTSSTGDTLRQRRADK
jgi:hypothetical protein